MNYGSKYAKLTLCAIQCAKSVTKFFDSILCINFSARCVTKLERKIENFRKKKKNFQKKKKKRIKKACFLVLQRKSGELFFPKKAKNRVSDAIFRPVLSGVFPPGHFCAFKQAQKSSAGKSAKNRFSACFFQNFRAVFWKFVCRFYTLALWFSSFSKNFFFF